MYEDIRTIWITLDHAKKWDQHHGFKGLRNLTLINIEHNMTGNRHSLYYLTCTRNYERAADTVVSVEHRRQLLNLSIYEVTDHFRHFYDDWITPNANRLIKGAIVKDLLNSSRLKIHVHFRCPSCMCNHCVNLGNYTYKITRTMVSQHVVFASPYSRY